MNTVNVLAVIDDAIVRALDDAKQYKYAPTDADNLREVRAAAAELITASRRVTAAFRAHGEAVNTTESLLTRCECERAIVALDAAISRIGGAP